VADARNLAPWDDLWRVLGLFARVYLIATSYPDTFPELRASIASRPLERRLAAHQAVVRSGRRV
jgi:hypothetical protein